MESHNQFEWLMNFGSSSEGFILVAAPFLILCVIAIAFTIYRQVRKKREIAEFEDILKSDESSSGAETENGLASNEFADENSWSKEFTPTSADLPSEPGEDSWSQDLSEEITKTKATASEDGISWLARLRAGLDKTRSSLQSSISNLFSGGGKVDDATLEQLHEILYRADLGLEATDRLVAKVRQAIRGQDKPSWDDIRTILRTESLQIFMDLPEPSEPPTNELWVILIAGVNGVGKTTTIGKLAANFTNAGMTVILCAADTFRAAAIDQLKVWGQRIGVPVVAKQQGGDPAAVVFDAIASAKAKKADVLIVDTAGRLHSKSDLMDELEKIYRVIKREIPTAPQDAWLVIDATTGQNAFAQVKAFQETAKVNGLVVTKLDGTAKGGVILGISEKFKLPIRFLGVGEKAEDLTKFNPTEFVDALFK